MTIILIIIRKYTKVKLNKQVKNGPNERERRDLRHDEHGQKNSSLNKCFQSVKIFSS